MNVILLTDVADLGGKASVTVDHLGAAAALNDRVLWLLSTHRGMSAREAARGRLVTKKRSRGTPTPKAGSWERRGASSASRFASSMTTGVMQSW